MMTKQHCLGKEEEEDVLCSSCSLELLGVWSSSEMKALSMAVGMSAWSWGPQPEQAEGLKPLKELWLPSMSIKSKGKELGGAQERGNPFSFFPGVLWDRGEWQGPPPPGW